MGRRAPPVRENRGAPQSAPASFDASMRSTLQLGHLAALAALLFAPLAFASTPVNINTADASTLAE